MKQNADNAMRSSYNMVGLMSGTSTDGLDLAAATFRRNEHRWHYDLLAAESIPYGGDWKRRLREAHELSLEDGLRLHNEYGHFLGERAKEFVGKHQLDSLVDAIASHGHTVLHDPQSGYTFQLGNGAAISAVTGIPVISDLRSGDMALGGQGAPVVPVGEAQLFPDHRIFINIGGIANISFHKRDSLIAYDVCPGNTPLNLLALLMGSDYDEDGKLAREGRLDEDLLHRLGKFSFYQRDIPRSLHTYQIANEFMPVLDMSPGTVQDKLRTVTEHIAAQLAGHINMYSRDMAADSSVLVTGGGAMNTFLVERLVDLSGREIVVPEERVVAFKEALIMAFLGLRRMRGEVTCRASVTGASRDNSSGAWHAV